MKILAQALQSLREGAPITPLFRSAANA